MRTRHYIITLCFYLGALQGQTYDVGDTVSLMDQQTPFEVCYGDYGQDSLKLEDFNGSLNGGYYTITFIALQSAI